MDGTWAIDKLGSAVLFTETIPNGSRYLHNLHNAESGVHFHSDRGDLSGRPILSLLSDDAGLVAPGRQADLSHFEDGEPDLSGGVAFLLYRLSPGWAGGGNRYMQDHTFPVYRGGFFS